ncbi:MAG: hypothetical protein DRH57_00330 [Candidatus Cloacimonadota bacterium]|nr:MAG: hypothetical protein DRH57_00330 [Candidatus Cloacimonadota bacterium]
MATFDWREQFRRENRQFLKEIEPYMVGMMGGLGGKFGRGLGKVAKWALPTFGLYWFMSGKKEKPQQPVSAIPQTPVITQEQYEAVKNMVKGMVSGAGTPDYFTQALNLPQSFLQQYQDIVSALGKTQKRQSRALKNLASAIPLVSTSGLAYWNPNIVSALEDRITTLASMAIPRDTSWDSLLRAKYARRALQALLPAYSRLVSATRQTITPSAVAPNLLVQAMQLETAPQTALLQALPSVYEWQQRALIEAAKAQAKAEQEKRALIDKAIQQQQEIPIKVAQALSRLTLSPEQTQALSNFLFSLLNLQRSALPIPTM